MIDNLNGIYTVDANYGRPNLASVHLIVDGDDVAIVETANASSLTYVESALRELNIENDAVKYIFLTHIHLDHAGGAGAFMQKFANALLVVHPRGVRHMIDPSFLEKSVIGVYGEEFVTKMYGKLIPVEPARILEAKDRLSIKLGKRELICLDTPGHANHHIAIYDSLAQGVFTGDVFGVAYPELINARSERFIFPTTTPVNFNPELMHASIDLIASFKPKAVYLTHFGKLGNVEQYSLILHKMVDGFVDIAKSTQLDADLVNGINQSLCEYMWQEAKQFGVCLNREQFEQVVALDNQISAQGLAVWLKTNN